MAVIANDLFTETINTALSAHTPNPTGTSWTLSAAQFQVIGAIDRLQHNRSTTDRAREETTVGVDTMDVSADVAVASANTRLAGVCARMSTDGFINQYEAYLQFLSSTQQNVFLFKNVVGTRTQIGSTATITLNQNVFCTLKLSIRAGTQEVFIDGVSVITGTEADSTLSGRTYAGVIMNGNNSSNASLDTYLSESVEASTPIAASDTLVVVETEAATASALTTVTAKSGTDTLAVVETEVATTAIAQLQKVGTDALVVVESESAVADVLTSVTIKTVTDALVVVLREQGYRGFRALDTVVVVIPTEATTLVKSTVIASPPTARSFVWRLTSGNIALLPHVASRDLEL